MKTVLLSVIVVVVLFITQVPSQRFGQQSYNNKNVADRPASSVSCPEKNGRFPVKTCDGYIECVDGVGEEKLCPDGLLFNPAAGIFAYPCQYPIDVSCEGRSSTQQPQPTDECPHQYGYYKLGDSSNCGQFMNCVEGRGYTFDCPEGLAFNEESYRCDWPDQVPSCDPESYLGFSCPPEAKSLGEEEYRYFRSPNDCQRYFICIKSKPRLYNCGEGYAYNDIIGACDGIENVTGCAVPQQQQQQQHHQGGRSQNQKNFYG